MKVWGRITSLLNNKVYHSSALLKSMIEWNIAFPPDAHS